MTCPGKEGSDEYSTCEDHDGNQFGACRFRHRARTMATNRWQGKNLRMDRLHEVSRKLSAWQRQPDPALMKNLS